MKKEFLNLLNGSTELLEDITKDGGGGNRKAAVQWERD